MVRIAPSILAADLADIGGAVARIPSADFLHVDVMDGRYVPNITFGQGMVAALRGISEKPLDVHLMIEHPENHLEAFAKSGASVLTLHPDSTKHLHRQLTRIKELGMKAGVALNPADSACIIENVLDLADLVLVMTVNPGFGGQSFIEAQLVKIIQVAGLIAGSGRQIMLEVDGGMNAMTAAAARKAGADVIVAGTYIFDAPDPEAAIKSLRG